MASHVSASPPQSNPEDRVDALSGEPVPAPVEALRLLKRKGELELLQRQFGGMRITEERELRAIDDRLADGVHPEAVVSSPE